MKIVTNLTCAGVAPTHLAYSATTDNYDGAPDANLPDRLIGMGPTAEAATADLLEQLEDFDPDWRDHYGTIESAECNMLRAQAVVCRNATDTGERCGFCIDCLTRQQPARGSAEDTFLITREPRQTEEKKFNYTGPLCPTCMRPALCRDIGPCDRVEKPEHDGTCEHGHPNCNPIGDKCGDECD